MVLFQIIIAKIQLDDSRYIYFNTPDTPDNPDDDYPNVDLGDLDDFDFYYGRRNTSGNSMPVATIYNNPLTSTIPMAGRYYGYSSCEIKPIGMTKSFTPAMVGNRSCNAVKEVEKLLLKDTIKDVRAEDAKDRLRKKLKKKK